MKIIAILWTMCLAGLCYCGDDAGDAKGTLKGVEKQNPPGPTDPESSLASKVDSSLFNVEEAEEDTVKVLKLTPKGDKVTKVNYDDKEVWSGGGLFSKSNLVEALIYFDGDIPVLTTIKAVKGGKESTVYRYYDGKQWKNGNKNTHKSKLEVLKNKYKLAVGDPDEVGGGSGRGGLFYRAIQVVTNPKLSQNLADIGKARYNLSGTASKDTLSTAIGWATSTITRTGNNTGTFKAAELPEGSVSYPPTLSSSKNANTHGDDGPGHSGGLSPVDVTLSLPTLAPGTEAKTAGSSSEPSTSVFLDISNPDKGKMYVEEKDGNGMKHTTYTPKSGSKMTSVVDDQASIWTASEKEKFVFAELSSKGESSLLLISPKTGRKYFEKNASGGWTSIDKDEYDHKLAELEYLAQKDLFNKLKEMRKSG